MTPTAMPIDINKINRNEVITALNNYNGPNQFIKDVRSTVHKLGRMSDKQLLIVARTLKVPSYANQVPQQPASGSVNNAPYTQEQVAIIIGITNYSGKFPFLVDLKSRITKDPNHRLSDKQFAAAKKCLEKENKQNQPKQVVNKPVNNTPVNNPAKAVANPTYTNGNKVKDENLSINPTNVVIGRSVAHSIKREYKLQFLPITLTVSKLHAQTEKAVRITARLTTGTVHVCRCCGASLTDWKSQATGMGPVCAKKLGVKYVTKKEDIAQFQKDLEARVAAIGDLTFWAPKSKFKEGINNLKQAIINARNLTNQLNQVINKP